MSCLFDRDRSESEEAVRDSSSVDAVRQPARQGRSVLHRVRRLAGKFRLHARPDGRSGQGWTFRWRHEVVRMCFRKLLVFPRSSPTDPTEQLRVEYFNFRLIFKVRRVLYATPCVYFSLMNAHAFAFLIKFLTNSNVGYNTWKIRFRLQKSELNKLTLSMKYIWFANTPMRIGIGRYLCIVRHRYRAVSISHSIGTYSEGISIVRYRKISVSNCIVRYRYRKYCYVIRAWLKSSVYNYMAATAEWADGKRKNIFPRNRRRLRIFETMFLS